MILHKSTNNLNNTAEKIFLQWYQSWKFYRDTSSQDQKYIIFLLPVVLIHRLFFVSCRVLEISVAEMSAVMQKENCTYVKLLKARSFFLEVDAVQYL